MHSWARLVVLELLRYDAERGTLRQRSIDPLIAAVLEEMSHRIDQLTTLEDLARCSGFSAQHLNRVFRRILGVTPLKYLMRMKLERSAQMLMDGRQTVAAIAATVGFDDPYYFSRVFRRHFGRSPAQYRDAAISKSPS
jgi:transcriptional regulator GlxA family with amidase domain